jgi:predicted alpha/beta-hydrolase family hydrolase
VSTHSEPLAIASGVAEPARVSAVLDRPGERAPRAALLLAHGSGLSMDHAWTRTLGRQLAERGFVVLRFNYPYRERALAAGRQAPPDRAAVLEVAHRAALAELRRLAPGLPLVLAGKSLGARIATLLAAADSACDGVIAFGYPLHPPGAPERERSEHFERCAVPALFLHGTRDEFGAPEALRSALRRWRGPAELQVVDGANHGFELPRAHARELDDVLAELALRADAWFAGLESAPHPPRT